MINKNCEVSLCMMVTNLTGGPIHLVRFKDESFVNNAQIMKSETGKVEDDYIYASKQDILNIDEIPWYFQNYYNIPSLGNKYVYEENNRKISVFFNSSILKCKSFICPKFILCIIWFMETYPSLPSKTFISPGLIAKGDTVAFISLSLTILTILSY